MTSETTIDPGADVIGANGEKVGTLSFVVVHPQEMHITNVVVDTGAFLGRDILVGADKIERVEDGKVYLSLDRQGLEACKDYIDVDFAPPPASWAPASTFSAYPTGMMLWPTGMAYPEATDVTVNAPAGTVGLNEGMRVESSDGEQVGAIERLEADPASGDVTALVIKQGHIFTHDAEIPAAHVRSIESDRVRLDLSADEVKTRFDRKGD